MRFLHLSDLHLGIHLMNRSLMEDQVYILNRILNIIDDEIYNGRNIDAMVIAGDIYDKTVPPAEAVKLFDRFITALRETAPDMEIMIISGNHDSAIRLNSFRDFLNHQHIHMIGTPPAKPDEHIEIFTGEDEFGPIHFWMLPFIKPSYGRINKEP